MGVNRRFGRIKKPGFAGKTLLPLFRTCYSHSRTTPTYLHPPLKGWEYVAVARGVGTARKGIPTVLTAPKARAWDRTKGAYRSRGPEYSAAICGGAYSAGAVSRSEHEKPRSDRRPDRTRFSRGVLYAAIPPRRVLADRHARVGANGLSSGA